MGIRLYAVSFFKLLTEITSTTKNSTIFNPKFSIVEILFLCFTL